MEDDQGPKAEVLSATTTTSRESSNEDYSPEIHDLRRSHFESSLRDAENTGVDRILRGRLLTSTRVQGFLTSLKSDVAHQRNATDHLREKIGSRFGEISRGLSKQEREMQAITAAFAQTMERELEELITAAWCRTGNFGIVDITRILEGFAQGGGDLITASGRLPGKDGRTLERFSKPLCCLPEPDPKPISSLDYFSRKRDISAAQHALQDAATTYLILHEHVPADAFSVDSKASSGTSMASIPEASEAPLAIGDVEEGQRPKSILSLLGRKCREKTQLLSCRYPKSFTDARKKSGTKSQRKLVGALPGGLSAISLRPPPPPMYLPAGLSTSSSRTDTAGSSTSESLSDSDQGEDDMVKHYLEILRESTPLSRTGYEEATADKKRVRMHREWNEASRNNAASAESDTGRIYSATFKVERPVPSVTSMVVRSGAADKVTEYWQLVDHLGIPHWIYRGRHIHSS